MLTRAPALFIVLLFLHVSLASERSEFRGSLKEIYRRRRQACADGTYLHEGKTCCLCGAGQKVKKHCTNSPDDGQCEFCEDNTFNSAPNSEKTCQPCKSCSQPNANLEMVSNCTRARNRVCRCKSGYFCDKDEGKCEICHACKTCDYGVYKECTQTSDAECHEKGRVIIITVAIIAVLAVAGAVIGGFLFLKKRKEMKREPDPAPDPALDPALDPAPDPAPKNGKTPDEEIPLRALVKDLQPFLSDVASELGWTDMKDVALRCGMKQAKIEACQHDHPHDSQEQTRQLLMEFVQKNGRNASKVLLQTLEKSGKKDKEEKIRDILSVDNQDGQNSSA